MNPLTVSTHISFDTPALRSLLQSQYTGPATGAVEPVYIDFELFLTISTWGMYSAGKAALSGVAKGGEKSIVIGEGMYRVKPAARSVGAKWYQAWSKNFPSGRLMTEAELNAAKARNARWLNSKIKQGYKIYDIGPKGTDIMSPFYQLERDIIQKTGYPTIPLTGF